MIGPDAASGQYWGPRFSDAAYLPPFTIQHYDSFRNLDRQFARRDPYSCREI